MKFELRRRTGRAEEETKGEKEAAGVGRALCSGWHHQAEPHAEKRERGLLLLKSLERFLA